MAIVSISRIQHRRGDRADLPTPLASGELGWAIDTQQLFIGNGSLAEGAPYVGNTEILTEHSDLSALFGYGGSSSGTFRFTGNGIGVASGVTRTVDNKLNDIVSVRDFGAEGDGAECSGAFNQALADLFRNGDQQTRIALYVPAGEYIINAALEIPPNTILVGDGMGNTVIRTDSATPLIRTVDANGDSGVAMGTVSTTLPNNILIRDITFKSTTSTNLTELQSTTNFVLERVEFIGAYTNLTVDDESCAGLGFYSPGSASASGKVTVTGCRFRQLPYAVLQTELLHDFSFDRCVFDTCCYGIILYIPGPDLLDPVTIQNSYFNNISREAIYAANITKFTSIGNRFVNVGNWGTGSPLSPVLTSEGEGSISWMDRFDRLPTELTPGPDYLHRVNLDNTAAAQTVAYANPEDRFRWGLKETLRTYKYSLNGGTSGSLSDISITANPGYNGNTGFQEVRYLASRGNNTRTGIIRLSVSAADVDIVDDYSHTGTDCGIEFTASINGSDIVTIAYTVTAGATPVTLVLSPTNLLIE